MGGPIDVTTRGLDAATVGCLVERLIGVSAVAVDRMPYGHFNVTYCVSLPERQLIVRTNRDPNAMAGTARNLDVLGELGLPVPRLIAGDLSMQEVPAAYLVLEKIPGRDLGYELDAMDESQMSAVAERVVEFQRLAATLAPGQGYGWVPIGEAGPHPTWEAVVQHALERYCFQMRTVLPGEVERRMLRRAHEMSEHMRSVPPTCFLDDLTTKNVIVERGELRGVVDFDVVCYGDPLYWLGLTRTAVLTTNGPRCAFYVDELTKRWNADEDVVEFYSAIFAVCFMGESLRQGGLSPSVFDRLVALTV